MEAKLKLFALWLKDHSETMFDPMTEGTLERAIRQAQDATMNKIGDMLLEILEQDDRTILDWTDDHLNESEELEIARKED